MRERQHWLWVTRPEYYLDEDGNDRSDLDPGSDSEPGWWTCHPDTKAGDLVLLYRTSPRRDIAYLFEAASDAKVWREEQPPGTLTPEQLDALYERARADRDDLDQRWKTLQGFEDQFSEFWASQYALDDEYEEMCRQFPQLMTDKLDGLPSHARSAQESWQERNQDLARQLEEFKEHLAQRLSTTRTPRTDSDHRNLGKRIDELGDIVDSGWNEFHLEVLRLSGLPEDTAVWRPGEFDGADTCEYRSRIKIEDPLPISEMRADPYLDEWPALKADFRRRAWPIEPNVWEELIELISRRNPDFRTKLANLTATSVSHDILSERQLEDALADGGLSVLDPGLELIGRQHRCPPQLWSIDLLCRDRNSGDYVVVELKVVKAREGVLAQTARYMGWVGRRFGIPREKVRGIIVARGFDQGFDYALESRDDVRFIELEQVVTDLGLDLGSVNGA